MSTELVADITIRHVVYAAGTLFAAILISLIARIFSKRAKKRLRSQNEAAFAAQILDDVEEPIYLLIVMVGFYVALLGLPPFLDYEALFRQAFTVLAVVLAIYAIVRVQGHGLSWYVTTVGSRSAQAKVLNTMLPMAKRTIAIVVLMMGGLVILDQLGIAIAPLIAGLGIAGLAVALALQGTLTSFFAGINILTDGAIRVGDYVELDRGLAGYIDQIGWRTTRIRMLENNMIIIPNSKLADSIATNYHFPREELSVYINLGVAYSSDLDHVEQVTVEVAQQVMNETMGSVEGYTPSLWYTEFADSNINFWVVLRAKGYMDMWAIKHNFIKALLRRYNQEGIEISFPARSVYFRGAEEQESASLLSNISGHVQTLRQEDVIVPDDPTRKGERK